MMAKTIRLLMCFTALLLLLPGVALSEQTSSDANGSKETASAPAPATSSETAPPPKEKKKGSGEEPGCDN